MILDMGDDKMKTLNELKRAILLGLSILTLSICFGCATRVIYYPMKLKEVERPAKAKERYGNQKITKVTASDGKDEYQFEDEMIRVSWLIMPNQIGFTMVNKTNHSIKIAWDEAAFVDVLGVSQRVIHSGVKYIEKSNPQPPSVVVRKGIITDIVVPSSNIYYDNLLNTWKVGFLLPTVRGNTTEELRRQAQQYVGRTIQVLLPLQIEDVVNEYIFTFEIESFQIR
jgi:hypothetical protein